MGWSRASELDRAVACPASTHLVRLAGKSWNAQKAADWGTDLHAWKETGKWPIALSGRWEGKVPLVYARRQANLTAAGRSREWYWPNECFEGPGRHEVSYALNTKTLTVAIYDGGDREEREAWKKTFGEEWLTGTADYVGDVLGEPWVDDLKTGNPEYLPENPWELWQLRFYALCMMLLSAAKWCWVSITSWPQSPADGIPHRFWNRMSRAEVLATMPTLEQARLDALASKVDTDARAGNQCGRWFNRDGEVQYLCPCAPVCPALTPAFSSFPNIPEYN